MISQKFMRHADGKDLREEKGGIMRGGGVLILP